MTQLTDTRFPSGAVRVQIPALLRGAIIERYRRTCQYCCLPGESLYKGPDGEPWWVDHKVPVALGGTNDEDNLTLSCAHCNRRKMTSMPDEPWQERTPGKGKPWFVDRSFRVRVARAANAMAAIAPCIERKEYVQVISLEICLDVGVREIREYCERFAVPIQKIYRDNRTRECLCPDDAVLLVARCAGVDPHQLRLSVR